jgi:hypothetical protein
MTTFMNDWRDRMVFKNGQLIDKDDDPQLRDGEVLRVPMTFMDSKPKEQPAISNYQVAADAHFAKTGMPSRSGSYSPDQQAARDARQTAYDAKLSAAWKTAGAKDGVEDDPDWKSLKPAQKAEIKGALAEQQAELERNEPSASPSKRYDERIANAWKTSPRDANAALDAARQRYHSKLENGWRTE